MYSVDDRGVSVASNTKHAAPTAATSSPTSEVVTATGLLTTRAADMLMSCGSRASMNLDTAAQ